MFKGCFVALALLPLLLSLAGVLPDSAPEQPPATGAKALAKYILPKGYVCQRAKTPIKVDGKLDDAAWEDAAWTDDFVDIEGAAKPKPRFRTRAKMLWDDNYFYIAAELEEPHVWGTLKEHDSVIFQDNDFEVFIDPNGDNHEYYEFEINALNTGWDLFLVKPYRDGGPAMNSWEILGLKTGVDIQGTLNDPRDVDKGWTVEIAVPWKVLFEAAHRPAPPREGDQWRVNFSRVEWQHEIADGKYRKIKGRKEDNWVWSPQGVIDLHRPEMWGYVQFSRKPAGSVEFRPDPTGPARHLLHHVYYAQRDFQKTHKRWAQSLDELGLKDLSIAGVEGPVTLETTRSLFEATAVVKMTANSVRRVHIRQDSLVWETAEPSK
jgi:hypothetical protein